MRRVVPVLLTLFVVAGCDGGALSPGPPGPAGGPGLSAQVKASFPRGGVADTIEIDAIDPKALRAAELIAPGGAAIPANYIDVTASPRLATGQWAAGNPWRNALSDGGPAATLTIPHAEAGAALQGEQQLLATVSSAEIALPDPVAYRRDWAGYRIRLTFGTPPGDLDTRMIAAPEPPPEATPQRGPQGRPGS